MGLYHWAGVCDTTTTTTIMHAHAQGVNKASAVVCCLSCRWQHQASDSLTKVISCPTIEAAAAAAADVLGSCQQQHAASTAHPTQSAATGQDAEDAGTLLAQQPDVPVGAALSALLSILKWADGICAAGAVSSGGPASRHRRGSSSGGSMEAVGSSDGGGHGPRLAFNVVLDERQHGTQSLLHSGLSRLQGKGGAAWPWCVCVRCVLTSARQLMP